MTMPGHGELYWEAVRTGERDDEDPHVMSALNFADELSRDLWAWLNSTPGVPGQDGGTSNG